MAFLGTGGACDVMQLSLTVIAPHPSSGLRETPDATFPAGEGRRLRAGKRLDLHLWLPLGEAVSEADG